MAQANSPTETRSWAAAPMAPGPKIDDIGDQQQHHDEPQKLGRIMASQIAGDTDSRYGTYPGADGLEYCHQGQAEQHRPGEAVAELSTDLATGRNAARIIVCGSGDQPRSEFLE